MPAVMREGHRQKRSWFILGVMLFSYAVRALYIESSSMFVRGGVYRVVKEAMGGTLAKFSVSALLFDYVLTGPISAVSAGQYLAGFIKDMGVYMHRPLHFSDDHFAAGLALSWCPISGGRIRRACTSPARKPCRSW